MARRCWYNCIILALLLCCISVSPLLCATSVWRPQRRGETWTRVTLALVRHCNLAHRSHHTPHNTTHCLHYTQPFEHLDTVSAASPDQRHIQWSSLHDNSKYKIPLPTPLSRNYHVAAVQIWNVGRMRSIVLLSLPNFAQFFLSFFPTVCHNIFLDILILDMIDIDIINPPRTQKTSWTLFDLSKSLAGTVHLKFKWISAFSTFFMYFFYLV